MSDASIVAFNSLNPLYMDMDDCNFPVYAVKFVPEDEKYDCTFMKLESSSYGSNDEKISFTKNVDSASTGIEILLFNSADAAAEAIIKLSLLGKSKRRTKGEYEVMELGNFNPNAKYIITKRITSPWAEKGMVMAMLMSRSSRSFDECIKHYENIKWQQGIASGSNSLTFEKLVKSRDSLGNVLSYEVGKFTIFSIYKVLFLKRAPWFFRFANRTDFKCNNAWEWAFLTDRYGIDKMEVGEKKIVPGPIECVLSSKAIDSMLKTHTEFGMTFSNDADPFLEYEITRVD